MPAPARSGQETRLRRCGWSRRDMEGEGAAALQQLLLDSVQQQQPEAVRTAALQVGGPGWPASRVRASPPCEQASVQGCTTPKQLDLRLHAAGICSVCDAAPFCRVLSVSCPAWHAQRSGPSSCFPLATSLPATCASSPPATHATRSQRLQSRACSPASLPPALPLPLRQGPAARRTRPSPLHCSTCSSTCRRWVDGPLMVPR